MGDVQLGRGSKPGSGQLRPLAFFFVFRILRIVLILCRTRTQNQAARGNPGDTDRRGQEEPYGLAHASTSNLACRQTVAAWWRLLKCCRCCCRCRQVRSC